MFKLSKRSIGFIQILLSGLCFGFLGFYGKMAYKNGISSGELLALRYFISAILTGLILFLFNRQSLKLTFHQTLISLLLGIFGYALFSSLFFIALTGLSASLTVLLLYTYPIMVTILSTIFLNEKITFKSVLALILVSLGLFGLVRGEWSIGKPIYLICGLLAAFFYALYIMLSRKFLNNVNAMSSSFYVQLGAGIVLTIIHFNAQPNRAYQILSHHWILIISMSILCSLIAMSLFLAGLQKITSTEASILSTTEPISGVIIATILLG